MKRRLSDGHCLVSGAVIESKIPVEASAASIDRWVGKRRHDPGCAIAIHSVFRWHQANITHFIAQAGIGQGFDGIEHLPIVWTRDALEEVDLGIARQDDPIDRFIYLATG